MEFTVQEIAKSIGAEFFGDPQIKVSSVAEPKTASELDIALAINPEYLDDLKNTLLNVLYSQREVTGLSMI